MINLVEKIFVGNLHLRMLDIPDAPALQHLMSSNKEYYMPWLPKAVAEPQRVEQKREQIREWKGAWFSDQSYTYGIFDDSALIGIMYLFRRQGAGTLEIGYNIDQHQAGKGYASVCTYALTKLGVEHLNVEKLYIICDPLNVPSARIPEKLGYQLEVIERRPQKDADGKRIEDMKWILFREDFQRFDKYEPIKFKLEQGW
ncbi:MAG: GNAT family N-acetyltransferase [Calditrichia bacterium]